MPLVGGVELMSSVPGPSYSIGVSPRSDDCKIAAMASYLVLQSVSDDRGRGEKDAATVDYCRHNRCEIFAADSLAEATKVELFGGNLRL